MFEVVTFPLIQGDNKNKVYLKDPHIFFLFHELRVIPKILSNILC